MKTKLKNMKMKTKMKNMKSWNIFNTTIWNNHPSMLLVFDIVVTMKSFFARNLFSKYFEIFTSSTMLFKNGLSDESSERRRVFRVGASLNFSFAS